MKKWLLIIGWGAIILIFSTLSWAQAEDGRQIMDTQADRHKVDSARDQSVMLLIDKNGNRKIREIKRYGKKSENGFNKTLLVFTSPPDLKGTTLMTQEISKGEYKQWIYLPGQQSLQRIAAKAKRSAFMGSDFTYEDMQPDNPDYYSFSSPRSETLDGHDCFVIDITPATAEAKKQSSYGRRQAWVRKDIYFTVKVKFYDRRDRLVKTQTCHELKNSHGNVWYAQKVLMDNHKKKHKTLMGIKTKDVNLPIEDALFSEKTILSKKHL